MPRRGVIEQGWGLIHSDNHLRETLRASHTVGRGVYSASNRQDRCVKNEDTV